MNYAHNINDVRITEGVRYFQQRDDGILRITPVKQRRINRLNRYYRRSQRGD